MPKQLAPGKFSWNEDERYFRDRNGVKVDRRNVRLGLDKYLDSQRDQTERLTERLRDGELSVGDWQLEMEAMIKRSHVAATALAKGGKDQVKAADWGVAGQAIRFEYERLNRFARELENGREVDGRVIQRAKMYAVAATGTYEAVLRRDDIAANFDMEMRHLHSENPCNQCELYTLPKGEWHPAGTLPGIGEQCSCLSNCRCTFERKRSAEAYARWKARNPKPPKPVRPPKPKPIEPPKPLPKPPEPPKARTPTPAGPAPAKPVAAPVVRELTPEERLGSALETQKEANRKWTEGKPPDNEYAKLRKRLPELIPPGPIQERIGKYVVGDEKLKFTLEVGEKYGKVKTELTEQNRKLTQDMLDIVKRQNDLVGPYVAKRVMVPEKVREQARALQAELDSKIAIRNSSRDRLNEIKTQAATEVHSMFRVKDGASFYGDLADNRMKVIKDLDPLDRDTQANTNKALTWLKSMIARGDKSELVLKVGQKEGQRAHYDPRGEHIALNKGQEPDVIIHEYAHGMEDKFETGLSNRLLYKSKEFLEYRAKGEPELQFNKKWSGYKDNEKGRKDKFEEAMGDERQAYYMGKTYYDASEIFSMGLQAFYNDPVRLAQKDPEVFKLVTGFMDGSLR